MQANVLVLLFIYAGVTATVLACICTPEDDRKCFNRNLYKGQRLVRKAVHKLVPQFVQDIFVYIAFKPNPILQGFYVVLVHGGYIVFRFIGLPYIPADSWHHYTHIPVMFACLYTFLMTSMKDPGILTKRNLQYYLKQYKYDGIIFHPNTKCWTCDLTKPARSKHCSYCDVCVARFDHHCVWVNNCIGAHNYGWFVSFLFTHVVFCFYAAYLVAEALFQIARADGLFDATFVDPRTNERIPPSYWLIFRYIIHHNVLLWIFFLLSFVMCFVLAAFFGHHFLTLVITNSTTNEEAKRYKIVKYITKWKKALTPERQKLSTIENIEKDRMQCMSSHDRLRALNTVESHKKADGAFYAATLNILLQRIITEPSYNVKENFYHKNTWTNIKEVFALSRVDAVYEASDVKLKTQNKKKKKKDGQGETKKHK